MKELVSTKLLHTMRERIERGDWKPGQKLPSLKQLAASFGAGVSTVREALRVLENGGYLTIEQGRGAFVRSPSSWPDNGGAGVPSVPMGSLLSLMEFRELLEPEIAALAAERATPGQAADIRKAAEAMHEDVRRGSDYFPSDLEFHELIAAACGNEVMSTVMKSVSDLLFESRKRTTRVPGSAARAAHFHMLIALAVEDRNAKLAKETMRLHLQDVRSDYERLRQEEGANGGGGVESRGGVEK